MNSVSAPARAEAQPLGPAPGREPPPPLRLLQRWTPPSASLLAAPMDVPAGPWWSRWWARPGTR